MLNFRLKGRYHIIKQLGGGGFSVTYTAKDEHIPDKPLCVVKQLKPLNPDPYIWDISQRLFEREAKTLYKLQHPQIPKLLAHFQEMGEFFLVQDYIDGDNLSQGELSLGKKLGEAEVIKLITEILEVLEFVHEQNIIHRDLNPRNLIRRKADGKLFLIDFGAVKEIEKVAVTKMENGVATVIGTSGFMAPEQGSGQPKLASDIYSVGIIAIQALTGITPDKLPKDPQGLSILLFAQTHVSPKLLKVIAKMTAYNFNDRYPSAKEALEAIKSLNPQAKFQPGDYGKFAAIGGAVLAAIGGLAIAFTNSNRSALPKFVKYENKPCGLTINYPENWGREEIFNRLNGEIVRFAAPTNSDNNRPSQMTVIATDISANPVSLQEYISQHKNNLIQQVDGFRLVTEGNATVANASGYRLDFTSVDEGEKLRSIDFIVLKDFKAYTLTLVAAANKYSDSVKIAEQMVRDMNIEPQSLDICFSQ